jgi:hypothetical protein
VGSDLTFDLFGRALDSSWQIVQDYYNYLLPQGKQRQYLRKMRGIFAHWKNLYIKNLCWRQGFLQARLIVVI